MAVAAGAGSRHVNKSLPDAIDVLRKRARLYHSYVRARAFDHPIPPEAEGVHEMDLAIMEGEVRAIEKRVIALAQRLTGSDPDPDDWKDASTYVRARHQPRENWYEDQTGYMRIFTEWADATKSYVLGLSEEPAEAPAAAAQTIIYGNVHYGDILSDINNSTVVTRSSVERAFNRLCADDHEDAAKALLRLGELVARSDNAAAGALFSALTGELQKPAPKKSVLKSMWDGLVAILPDTAKLADAAAKLLNLGGA
jgi:hypothetical protein